MPITDHVLWYRYVFQGLIVKGPQENTRTEAMMVLANGYQQCISISAFMHGVKRPYKDTLKVSRVENGRKYDSHLDMLWIGKLEDEYQSDQRRDERFVEKYQPDSPEVADYFRTLHPNPTRSFDSVYDFYKHIRYDYKTKKFLKP